MSECHSFRSRVAHLQLISSQYVGFLTDRQTAGQTDSQSSVRQAIPVRQTVRFLSDRWSRSDSESVLRQTGGPSQTDSQSSGRQAVPVRQALSANIWDEDDDDALHVF
jgi:hypothetical protein